MPKPWRAWGMIVIGLVIIVLSGFADAFGLGQHPGFGWKQAAGMAIGIAVLVRGIYWRRRLRRRAVP